MSAPPNQTPATAIVITALPFSATIIAADFQLAAASAFTPSCLTPRHTVWYQLTAPGTDTALGIQVTDASTQAGVSVWAGDVSSPDQLDDVCAVLPGNLQLNVVPGTVYYIALDAHAVTVTADITIDVLPPAHAIAPAGAILITNDVSGFPATILSATDGTILQSFALPVNNEHSWILPNGIFCCVDDVTGFIDLFDRQFALITSVDMVSPAQRDVAPISSDSGHTFWICSQGGSAVAVIKTLSDAGVVGGQTWTLPSDSTFMEAMSPSRDGTILYYAETTQPAVVHRYDLVNDVPLSDFFEDGSGTTHVGRDILVLASGDILIEVATNNVSGDPVEVRRYDPDGTLLATYDLGANFGSPARIAIGFDDPDSFWSMSFPVSALNGPSRFQQFRVADGALLRSFDVNNWEPGQPNNGEVFGPSQSCPLLLLLQPTADAVCATIVCPQGYGVVEKTIRRERIAPHLSNDQKNVFYPAIQVEVRPGTGHTIPPGVNPKVMLSVSFDGGYNWTPETWMGAGELGDYRKRLIARQLGYGRDVVFKVVVSDPNIWDLVNAYFDPPPIRGRH